MLNPFYKVNNFTNAYLNFFVHNRNWRTSYGTYQLLASVSTNKFFQGKKSLKQFEQLFPKSDSSYKFQIKHNQNDNKLRDSDELDKTIAYEMQTLWPRQNPQDKQRSIEIRKQLSTYLAMLDEQNYDNQLLSLVNDLVATRAIYTANKDIIDKIIYFYRSLKRQIFTKLSLIDLFALIKKQKESKNTNFYITTSDRRLFIVLTNACQQGKLAFEEAVLFDYLGNILGSNCSEFKVAFFQLIRSQLSSNFSQRLIRADLMIMMLHGYSSASFNHLISHLINREIVICLIQNEHTIIPNCRTIIKVDLLVQLLKIDITQLHIGDPYQYWQLSKGIADSLKLVGSAWVEEFIGGKPVNFVTTNQLNYRQVLTILEAVSIAEMQMLVPKRIFDTFVNEVSRQLEVFILKVVDKPLPMQKFNKIDEFIRLISVERLANIWSAKQNSRKMFFTILHQLQITSEEQIFPFIDYLNSSYNRLLPDKKMAFAQLYCEEVINNLITAFLEKRLIFWSLIRFAAFASSLSTIGSWFYKIIDLLPLNHLVSNSLSITQNISFVAWITYSIDKEALYLTLKQKMEQEERRRYEWLQNKLLKQSNTMFELLYQGTVVASRSTIGYEKILLKIFSSEYKILRQNQYNEAKYVYLFLVHSLSHSVSSSHQSNFKEIIFRDDNKILGLIMAMNNFRKVDPLSYHNPITILNYTSASDTHKMLQNLMKFNIGHKNVRQILLAIINQNSLQYPLEARRIVWSRIMQVTFEELVSHNNPYFTINTFLSRVCSSHIVCTHQELQLYLDRIFSHIDNLNFELRSYHYYLLTQIAHKMIILQCMTPKRASNYLNIPKNRDQSISLDKKIQQLLRTYLSEIDVVLKSSKQQSFKQNIKALDYRQIALILRSTDIGRYQRFYQSILNHFKHITSQYRYLLIVSACHQNLLYKTRFGLQLGDLMRLKFKELQISDSVCPITRNALLAKLFGEPLKE